MLKLLSTALRRGDKVFERDDLVVRDGHGGAGTALTQRTGSMMQGLASGA